MKAMILAAGLGTRLRPLTNDRPKALVEVAGRTLLEMTLERLRTFGIRDVIVNVHHFADMMVGYLKTNDNFGMNVAVSEETDLLDTGGALKKASWFFRDDKEAFLLHNVDVISDIDFARMLQWHSQHASLATLAVQDRETSRYLLFDANLQLCGRRAGREGATEIARPCVNPQALAFSGIHVISPELLPEITEEGCFSIITTYLRLASQGQPIGAFRADEYHWRDVGKPESVARAAEELRRNSSV